MIREDLISELSHYLSDILTEYEDRSIAWEKLDQCSVEQLWALFKLKLRNEKFKILHCDPKDHLAIQYANCYCGIEIDGYMHS